MRKETGKMTEEEKAMVALLRAQKIRASEVLHFVQEGLKRGRGKLGRAEKCMAMGEEEMKRNRRTVSFAKAVEAGEKEREGRRERTRSDFRYLTRRLMKKVAGLAQRRVRSIRSEECAAWIETAFSTPSQRKKGRAALSGVFSTARRHGWCEENPVSRVAAARVKEKRISILSMEEIERLLQTAQKYEGGKCLAAVGIMLYAGVRPYEVARLTWGEVHEEAGVICVPPQHSKTGGGRQVTLHPALKKILRTAQRRTTPRKEERICPGNWRRHWRELHRAAGWIGRRREGESPNSATRWQPDVLRHTFATHYLAVYRNYKELQVEMGHRDTTLLRTRYLSLCTPVKEGIFGKASSTLAHARCT